MKILSLFVVLFVTGCATVPTAKTTNPDCDRVASFAKGMAMLRETGLSQNELEAHISQPTIQPFPITLIRKQIYAENLNDQQAYASYYSKCEVVGYKQLLSIMEDEDELARLANENANLIERTSVLTRQVEYLKQFEPKVYVNLKSKYTPPPAPEPKVYGAPLDPYKH
jgi:hypothetical protein